ncbi:hypothetical protein GGR54DRAFT_596224 [Hypoxylon sp. NC1633]|nr:hypothetical protein GGR54DRAFT_596224 [Hypoxylon sp. NC1633]
MLRLQGQKSAWWTPGSFFSDSSAIHGSILQSVRRINAQHLNQRYYFSYLQFTDPCDGSKFLYPGLRPEFPSLILPWSSHNQHSHPSIPRDSSQSKIWINESTMPDSSVAKKNPAELDPVTVTENAVDDTEDLSDEEFVEITKTTSHGRYRQDISRFEKVQGLLPFIFCPNVRPLSVVDLESCVALENAAFTDPAHRCTREKFEYRLTACPELCHGLFCTVVPDSVPGFEIDTLPPSHLVETGRNDGARSVLLAHIVATRSDSEVVTDAAMDYPHDFRTERHNTSGLGHQGGGPTVCIHSLAVHPKLQGCGLGKLLMISYLQQLRNSDLASRCALICRDYLVPFYKKFGFLHKGESRTSFGGGGWQDMVLTIANLPPYSVRPSRK